MAETSPGRSQGVHGMDLEKPWEGGPKTSNPQTTEVHAASEGDFVMFSVFVLVEVRTVWRHDSRES